MRTSQQNVSRAKKVIKVLRAELETQETYGQIKTGEVCEDADEDYQELKYQCV